MIWTWLRDRLGSPQEDTAVTLALTCGGRIRLQPGPRTAHIELTSPPDGRDGPSTTSLELSAAEAIELQAALAAANEEMATTA